MKRLSVIAGKLRRLPKWLVQTQPGRWCLWGVVILLTLLVLMYQVANWGGARAWAKALAMLEAEGETLDFLELAPDPGPPEENFGALAALKDIGVVEEGDIAKGKGAEARDRFETLRLSTNEKEKRPGKGAGESFAFGERRDLGAWLEYLEAGGRFKAPEARAGAALDILEALAAADQLVVELAAGLERPEAIIVPRWEASVGEGNPFEIMLPHYQAIQAAAQFFSLRAIASARAGDEEKALESLLISLRICRLAATDRLLISALVANATLQVTLDALWEGLDARVFSPGSLARLRAEMERFDFREMMLEAVRTEAAAAAQALGLTKGKDLGELVAAAGNASGTAGVTVSLFPGGWIDRNRATIVDWHREYYIRPLKTGSLLSLMDKGDELEQLVEEGSTGFQPHRFLAAMVFPAYAKVVQQLIYTEAVLVLASGACAVEAYQAEMGAYPRNLEDLVPKYLEKVPGDPMSEAGAPLQYLRFVDGGRCRIWSVGRDGEDDGGQRILEGSDGENHRPRDREYEGDWVWSYESGSLRGGVPCPVGCRTTKSR